MSHKHRSRPRSADSTGTQKQKSKQKFTIASLVSNAVSSKQLSKTPIYNHKQPDIHFTGNRVQSDFVYIPPTASKTSNNTTKSDTCHEQLKRKKIFRRSPIDSPSINKKNEKRAVSEKPIHKKGITILTAEPSQKDNPFVHEKRELTRYKLTEEDIDRIQSTMPPGEVVIVPRTLTRVNDKSGYINYTTQSAAVRQCLCQPLGILKISTSDASSKEKIPKRSVSFTTDKSKRSPSPKRKRFSSAIDDNDRKTAKVTNNKKRPGLSSVQDEIEKIFSKKAQDPFDIRNERRFKNTISTIQEKKVDEDDPYKALISASTGRINRSQYQLYFNLRIRGRSVFQDLTFDPVQIYSLGERGSGLRARGEVQDFYKIRDELLESGSLFEDPEFPPTNASLFYSQRPDRYFEWKRPHEICDNPQLFVEGYSRFDVQQGELGDCWLLAAVANLTLYRRLFFQVVPDDQSFDEKYAGIFHFRFWQYGRWIDVVIDDRLPTYNGELVFLHSTEDNEFWSALLEKAYAKLHGSYEALKGGSTCEAMEDFTGGVTEMYEMNASPPNLFKIILKAYERSSLMGCSLEPDPNVLEAETRDGLIRGHAYSITKVRFVNIQTPNTVGKIPLLRLRNPWGNESEWNGPWSDKSPEWRFIPEVEKQELGLTFDDDGEFWMSFKDFQTHFDRLEICNLNPDSLTEEEAQEGNKKKWEVSFYEGEWVRGVTAGGCRNYLETFWHNPQYRVTLTEVDEGEDDGKCTLIVALMQKNRRSQRNMGIDVLTIGFAIYYLPNPDILPKPLNLNFFKYNASVARSPSFINLREVSCRFKLPPGTYCIVPSTFEPNEEGEFLLRVFSEHQNHMVENDEDIGYGEVDQRVKDIQPTPKEAQEKDQVYQFFLKLAGEDGEVDWMELKEILDYAMRLDAPMYRTDAKAVEAGGYPHSGYSGYPQQQQQQETPGDSNCCTQLLVIGGAALCCFLCMQLCNKDNQSQTNASNTLAPLATGCLANLCAGNATGNATNNPHVNYNTVDNQIITSPPDLTTNHADQYEMRNKGFSPDVCRSMVAMLDSDRSGKLGFEEFKALWSDVRDWKNVFRMYDRDNSGTLDGFELRQALNSAGYHLNNHILNILMHRYGNKQGQLEFDDYIMCAVKLKTMINIFKSKDPDSTNSAQFTMEEWIISTLYA